MNVLEQIDGGYIQVENEFAGATVKNGELHEPREAEIARYRQRIGMVFQHFNLFSHLTALENVAIGLVKVGSLIRLHRAGVPAPSGCAAFTT